MACEISATAASRSAALASRTPMLPWGFATLAVLLHISAGRLRGVHAESTPSRVEAGGELCEWRRNSGRKWRGLSLRLAGEAALEALVEDQQRDDDQQVHNRHACARWQL